MNDKRFFISVIEDVRKARNIVIDDLTEGIVSSRTYIRYVKNYQTARVSIIEKILKRLDLKFSEIIFHYAHKTAGHSDMNLFMIHFKRGHYDLCKPYYLKLKNHIDEVMDYKYLIEAYLALYEFTLQMIEADLFKEKMKTLLTVFEEMPIKTMYYHYFKILFSLYVDDNPQNILSEVDFLLDEDNVNKRVLQYHYLLPKTIEFMIHHKMDKKIIYKLLNIHKKALIYRQDMFSELDNFYLNALYYQYIEDFNLMKDSLIKFALLHHVAGSKDRKSLFKKIQDEFKIDINKLIVENQILNVIK